MPPLNADLLCLSRSRSPIFLSPSMLSNPAQGRERLLKAFQKKRLFMSVCVLPHRVHLGKCTFRHEPYYTRDPVVKCEAFQVRRRYSMCLSNPQLLVDDETLGHLNIMRLVTSTSSHLNPFLSVSTSLSLSSCFFSHILPFSTNFSSSQSAALCACVCHREEEMGAGPGLGRKNLLRRRMTCCAIIRGVRERERARERKRERERETREQARE